MKFPILSYIVLGMLPFAAMVSAQNTEFTYQALLTDKSAPATGSYEFSFALFSSEAGGAPLAAPATRTLNVAGGLFRASLDFGASVFNGDKAWLEISVRTNGASSYSVLVPRQLITPTPYAIFATRAGAAATAEALADGPSLAKINAAVTAVIGADSANTANTLVRRDASGNLAAASITLSSNLVLASGRAEVRSGGVAILQSLPTGSFFAGQDSGGVLSAGDDNTGFGANSLANLDAGRANTAVGAASLFENTAGDYNTALGFHALYENTLGIHNTANGASALAANTQGGSNTALGSGAMRYSQIASNNIALGANAGANLKSGNDNIYIGNAGADQDQGQIRIGVQGAHTSASIAGIHGSTISGGRPVFVTATGQLGTAAPSEDVVMQNADPKGTSGFSMSAGQATGKIFVTGPDYPLAGAPNSMNFLLESDGPFVFWNNTGGVLREHMHLKGNELTVNGAVRSQTIDSGDVVFKGATIGVGDFGRLVDRGDLTVFGTITAEGPLVTRGDASVSTLTIRGGADIAEPFHMSDLDIAKGSIVVIDEDNPGKLKLTDQAYDRRVAGIVSGANGIQPGLNLSQQGILEGGQNVALSGRVYALADTSTGPIKPGDLLTTSSTPGHCMKVTDHSRGQGAVIGKAMSSLAAGKGMVLVLVSLQ